MAEERKNDSEQAVAADTSREGGWSDLIKKEDYWAIWIGLGLILAALIIYLPRPPEGMDAKIGEANRIMEAELEAAPFKTMAWHNAKDEKASIKAASESHGKAIKKFFGKTHGWSSNPLEAFYMSEEEAAGKKAAAMEKYNTNKAEADSLKEVARTVENLAREAAFSDENLNADADDAIEKWQTANSAASKAKKKTKVSAFNQVGYLFVLCFFFGLVFSIGIRVMGGSALKFLIGFLFVFAVALLAYLLSTQLLMKEYGIGYAAWAIFFGMLISNTVGTPRWVMPAVKTEYFIKTGLVILGAEILFGKILTIGIPGIFVAWVVTPIVLVTTYLFGQRVLKIASKTLNITISADMSVCGVSAAIATAAACKAKKEELTLAVGLSLIFTSIMMIVMPLIIKALGIPFILGGAWMGGTIDATGAVAAAGAFLSDKALYVAATIKMIQNVLIGVTAFFVALYWVLKVERQAGVKVSKMEIWYRFPKFVLGFIGVSIIFSLIYESMGADAGYVLIDQGVISGGTKLLRGWFFCLAFVSIGLATNFRELAEYFKGGKPLILYVCGQGFNLCLTLFMAWLMFYKIFPHITAKI
jgi:uncharacterized membrane protein YadS